MNVGDHVLIRIRTYKSEHEGVNAEFRAVKDAHVIRISDSGKYACLSLGVAVPHEVCPNCGWFVGQAQVWYPVEQIEVLETLTELPT